METPTSIEEDDEVKSKKVLSFVIELEETLLQIVKLGDRCTAAQLVDLLTNTASNLNVTLQYIKSIANCKDFTIATREAKKDNDICKVLLGSDIGKEAGCGTPYMKNVT